MAISMKYKMQAKPIQLKGNHSVYNLEDMLGIEQDTWNGYTDAYIGYPA